MANDEHVALLKQGVDAWNAWREKNPDIQPDLSEANLSEADLGRANLSGANLSGAKLPEAILIQAKLSQANLIKANLAGANLSWANGTFAFLTSANLTGANLEAATLLNRDLTGADLTGCRIHGEAGRTTGTTHSPRLLSPARPDASWASLWLAYRAGPASGVLVSGARTKQRAGGRVDPRRRYDSCLNG